jgi:hypothetical protein
MGAVVEHAERILLPWEMTRYCIWAHRRAGQAVTLTPTRSSFPEQVERSDRAPPTSPSSICSGAVQLSTRRGRRAQPSRIRASRRRAWRDAPPSTRGERPSSPASESSAGRKRHGSPFRAGRRSRDCAREALGPTDLSATRRAGRAGTWPTSALRPVPRGLENDGPDLTNKAFLIGGGKTRSSRCSPSSNHHAWHRPGSLEDRVCGPHRSCWMPRACPRAKGTDPGGRPHPVAGPDGAKPLANLTIVRAVGCLSAATNDRLDARPAGIPRRFEPESRALRPRS